MRSSPVVGWRSVTDRFFPNMAERYPVSGPAHDGEMAVRLTWDRVAAWRAGRHHIDERAPHGALLAAAGDICGLHAQLMSSAELTAWARVARLAPEDVSNALWRDRTLVKTWAMRGTLHLLPSAEYSVWQAALSRFRHYTKPAWLRGFRISREQLELLLAAVPEALDGPPLTREELAQAIAAVTGHPELAEKVKGSWGSLLKPSAYRGDLCFAPSAGQNVRFTRPDRWLDLGPPVDPESAAAEVTRRFLAANGPATREDYGRWWGSTPAEAGKLIAALGDEVTSVEVDGSSAWLLAEHVEAVRAARPPCQQRTVGLLPAFDQYVVGATRHADHLLPGPFRDRVYRPQGWLTPVLAVGGRMLGVWRHERKGSRVTVQIEPFVALPPVVRRATKEEAEQLATFLGGTLDLTVTPGP
jgi:hypothetical protein